jgi:hypothetical protein
MQPTHHRQHQQESLGRSKSVPMRRDEEQNAGPEQQTAETERQPCGPAQGGPAGPVTLPGADADGDISVEQSGLDPALKRRLPGSGHWARYSALLVRR